MSRTSLFILLSVIAACVACNTPEVSPYPPLQWSKAADFPDGARSSATVSVANGKAYLMFGKRNVKTGYLQECWEYDTENDSWTRKNACPGPGRVKPISLSLNDKIYTGLGYTDTTYIKTSGRLYLDTLYLKDFWCYDPQTDTWTEEARAPFKGTDACVAFTYHDEIYVGLGFYGTVFGEEWWKYNPREKKWTRLKNFSGLNRAGALLCSNGERIFTGTGYRTYNLNDWWEYFPDSDTWKERKKMPDNGRVNGTALSVGNRMFVMTGRLFKGNLTGGHVKSTVIEYDMERDVWYDAGHIPGPARENAVAFTIGNRGYVGLGENDDTLLNDLMYFEL